MNLVCRIVIIYFIFIALIALVSETELNHFQTVDTTKSDTMNDDDLNETNDDRRRSTRTAAQKSYSKQQDDDNSEEDDDED
ncbi:unnamed protein product, partial [Rotaria magnacalcarata]